MLSPIVPLRSFLTPHLLPRTSASRTLARSTASGSLLLSNSTYSIPARFAFPAAARNMTTSSLSSVPSTMKAILIRNGTGDASSLYIGQYDVPRVVEGEVLVQVKAFGLNRMDIMQRQGKYPLPPSAPKDIMGVEFSGIVVGGVTGTDWSLGDEVFGLATGGAYAEYVKVPSKMILKKDAALSWEQAASIPEAFLTAFQALRFISDIKAGEDILIHAGASGVGLAAIQLAKAFGVKGIYVTAGSEEKIKTCEELGATKGFNYKTQDWGQELASVTEKQGVDVILDFIGAPYYDSNISSLKRDGRLVFLAFMGGSKTPVDLAQLLFKRLHLEGTTLRSRSLEYQSSLVQAFVKSGALQKLVEGVGKEKEQGQHRIQIHKVFDWEQIKEAHEEMEANRNTGKIVIKIPSLTK